MNKWIVVVCCCLCVAGCRDKNTFIIEGNIKSAANSMLYFEHIGISQVDVLDSIKLDNKGSFKWEQLRPPYPDFYRLRLKNQHINMAVDSLETITIQADSAHFATEYVIEGSKNCEEIKKLSLLQLKCNQFYNALRKEWMTKTITEEEFSRQVNQIVTEYKDSAAVIILGDTQSTAAYFALFQQVNGMLILDPYQKEDLRYFSAVATAWDLHYLDAPRTEQLRNLALSARKTIRNSDRPVEYKEANVIDLFDIRLPDIHGDSITLSEVCKGKVVLLDFTAYQAEGSAGHNMRLYDLYEKYKSNGLMIYQVSLDTDDHLWKNVAYNIPWFCVRDGLAMYSPIASNYNVRSLPTTFIMHRSGVLVERVESYEQMAKDIAKLF